jgi:hypothetical protein
MLRRSPPRGCGWIGSAHYRRAFGANSFGPLGNVALLERLEPGAPSVADDGSVVELYAYALVERSDERLLKVRLSLEFASRLSRARPQPQSWPRSG